MQSFLELTCMVLRLYFQTHITHQKENALSTHLLSSRTGAIESLEVGNLLTANSRPHFHGRCFCQDCDLALHPNTQSHDEALMIESFLFHPL